MFATLQQNATFTANKIDKANEMIQSSRYFESILYLFLKEGATSQARLG